MLHFQPTVGQVETGLSWKTADYAFVLRESVAYRLASELILFTRFRNHNRRVWHFCGDLLLKPCDC